MKKIILFVSLILSVMAVSAQSVPTSPILLTTHSAYYEPSTHNRWYYSGGAGVTPFWWQGVDSVQMKRNIALQVVLTNARMDSLKALYGALLGNNNWSGHNTYQAYIDMAANSPIVFHNSAGTFYTQLNTNATTTQNNLISFPNKTGVIALTSDLGTGTLTYSLTNGYGVTGSTFNNTGNVTWKTDSTTIQTIDNFFPKADTRYYTKTIADGRYGTLTQQNTSVTNITNLQNRNINTGYGTLGGGNLTADRTIIADSASAIGLVSKSRLATNLTGYLHKTQAIVNADDYTDSFTGWNADGFNHGSAIWQILNAYSFTNVKILLSNKTYKPISNDSIAYTIYNVSLQGVRQPAFKDSLKTLDIGTVIQGGLRIKQSPTQLSSNISITDLGFDAGKTVTDLYYSGADIQGVYFSYAIADDPGYGSNFYAKNVTVLIRTPTGSVHGFLVERFNNVYLDNIRTCFGIYGTVIKSSNVHVGLTANYGNLDYGQIIKAGEITAIGNITIDDALSDQMPPEVTHTWVSIPKAQAGFYLLSGFSSSLNLPNVMVSKVRVYNAFRGIDIDPTSNTTISGVTIGEALIQNCNYGLVRDGTGTVTNVYIGYLGIDNTTVNALDFYNSSGVTDSNFRIGTLNVTNSSAASVGIQLNSCSLEVGTYNVSNVTDAVYLVNSSKLILNNYVPGSGIVNYLHSGSLSPISTNVTADANGNVAVLGNLSAGQFFVSSLNAAPSTSTSTGSLGEIRITATAIYVCTATNTWVKAALATF